MLVILLFKLGIHVYDFAIFLINEENIVLLESERSLEEDNTSEENKVDQEVDIKFIDSTLIHWAINPYHSNEFVETQSKFLMHYIEFRYPPPDFS